MIRDCGEIKVTGANEMNIPVCCFLQSPEEQDEYIGMWTWGANNYMPRKNLITEDQYQLVADTKEEILGHIKKYVIPIYQAAIDALGEGGLYYWELKDGEK
jgi:hypothetical protein